MVVSETEFQYLVVRVDEPLQKLGGIWGVSRFMEPSIGFIYN